MKWILTNSNLTCFEIILPVSTKTLRPKLTQAERLVTGLGVKMFTIAWPVIVYGVSASVIFGLIDWLTLVL